MLPSRFWIQTESQQSNLIAWTTTPWTLPSNQFAAVKKDLTYVVIRFQDDPEHEYVLPEPLATSLAEKKKAIRFWILFWIQISSA